MARTSIARAPAASSRRSYRPRSGISVIDLRAKSRGRAAAAFARQTAMHLAHGEFLGLDLSRVGSHFGRDRTTVAHACARVEDSRDNPKVERTLQCLEAALDRWQRSFLGLGDAPMTPKAREVAAKLLRRLCADPAARLVAQDKGYAFAGSAVGKDPALRQSRARASDLG